MRDLQKFKIKNDQLYKIGIGLLRLTENTEDEYNFLKERYNRWLRDCMEFYKSDLPDHVSAKLITRFNLIDSYYVYKKIRLQRSSRVDMPIRSHLKGALKHIRFIEKFVDGMT